MGWTTGWVPFATAPEGGYDALILDLNPGRHGTYGQVWILSPGSDLVADDLPVAPSFTDLSMELFVRLKSRRFHIENNWFIFDDDWLS
ncbi:MAG: hypothetical protein LBR20_01255 [Propionibacteriaceae bacterium]|jgi:cell wall assembly regulator SMI1|nr:hypothetical protein [Propionibacteriaceae bacterium]